MIAFSTSPEHRLAKASPQAVRRIKNNLGSNERVSNGRLGHSEAKRNSLIEGNMTLQPKQPNWASQPKSPTRRISDEYHGGSSVGVTNSSRQLQPQQQERRQKMKRTHVYEDVESPEPQPPMIHVSDSHARTRSWVESHNERMWAGEDVERSDSAEGHRRGEGHRHGDVAVGSLWASRNRPESGQHQTRGAHPSSTSSKERRHHPKMSRLGGRGHLPTTFAPPPMTVESELLGSSYSRAASLPTSHLTAGLAGSSSRRTGIPTSRHQGLGSKKISYSIAVGVSPVDIPDKDMLHHHGGRGRRDMERGERFSSSEHYTSSTTSHTRSRSRDGGEQNWQGTDTGYGTGSSRSSHAHHHGQGHAHHSGIYPRQFNSLQRQLSPPQAQPQHHYSTSRRSSESSRDSYGGSYVLQENQEHYSHYGGGPSRGGRQIVPQRTYSNDTPHGQRVEGMGPSPIPNRESYL